jgi:hypothetical protein
MSSLGREFGFSKDQLWRHKNQHISGLIAKRVEYVDTAASNSLLEKIDKIVSRCEEIFLRNQKKGKDIIALKALSEQRATFQLIAQISVAMHNQLEAKIEYEKLRSGEYVIDQSMQYQHNLAVLSMEELQMLQALTEKLEKQDPTIQILPRTTDFQPVVSSPFAINDGWNESGSRAQNKAPTLKRSKFKSQHMKVQEIPSTPIPG